MAQEEDEVQLASVSVQRPAKKWWGLGHRGTFWNIRVFCPKANKKLLKDFKERVTRFVF